MIFAIWLAFFLIGAFGPMRWSLVAVLCLSVIDFEGGRGGFASLNVIKGLVLPLYLLWRLRKYSGHSSLRLAPIAWLLFIGYVGVACSWSLFPASAHKLVVQMLGSFLIVCVFIRATKGGFLTPMTAVATTTVCLILAVLRSVFFPSWGDDPARFTAFVSAQAFGALLASCYCVALCGKGLHTVVRVAVCSLIAGAIILDGSRTWFIGIVMATLLSLLLSRGHIWLKICAFSSLLGLLTIVIGASDYIFKYVAVGATGNRIASAVTALHQGDIRSAGLGTFNFRRRINDVAIERLQSSSLSELIFGRGTCNGAVITASMFSGYSNFADPNRMFHNEWLRVIYEWGLIGATFWVLFFGSIISYAITGCRIDPDGNAKPLIVYLPAFMLGLAGENMLAGADIASNMGFVLTIALSTIPHRELLIWRCSKTARQIAITHNRLFENGKARKWHSPRHPRPAPLA